MKAIGFDTNVEILEYFGSVNLDVKRFLRNKRTRPDLPYVIFVTSRARMGDAFPMSTKFFIELAAVASDLNSLLQGLLGRACGFGKETTVIMSERNVGIVKDWLETKGGGVYHTCRHSIPINYMRGPRHTLGKFWADEDDATVKLFIECAQAEIAAEFIDLNTPTMTLKVRHSGSVSRKVPLLQIVEKMRLFDYAEGEGRYKIFSHLVGDLKFPRIHESVFNEKKQQHEYYNLDENDHCQITFRWGGGGGGGRGLDSQTDRARVAGRLEPQINMEKYDPQTGKTIDDRNLSRKRKGCWRVSMIAFPFKKALSHLVVASEFQANSNSVLRNQQNRVQQDAVLAAERQRKAA